jgi:hypothetical protein
MACRHIIVIVGGIIGFHQAGHGRLETEPCSFSHGILVKIMITGHAENSSNTSTGSDSHIDARLKNQTITHVKSAVITMVQNRILGLTVSGQVQQKLTI